MSNPDTPSKPVPGPYPVRAIIITQLLAAWAKRHRVPHRTLQESAMDHLYGSYMGISKERARQNIISTHNGGDVLTKPHHAAHEWIVYTDHAHGTCTAMTVEEWQIIEENLLAANTTAGAYPEGSTHGA